MLATEYTLAGNICLAANICWQRFDKLVINIIKFTMCCALVSLRRLLLKSLGAELEPITLEKSLDTEILFKKKKTYPSLLNLHLKPGQRDSEVLHQLPAARCHMAISWKPIFSKDPIDFPS